MHEANRFTRDEWATRLESIGNEIISQAAICKVRLLEPGVIERVLRNDTQVCDGEHPTAFETLRGLLAMVYTQEQEMFSALGPDEALALGNEIRENLRQRLGDRLG